MISNQIQNIYNKSVDIIFGIILLFIMLGIAIGAVQLFSTTWQLLKLEGITGHYIDIITDVLTLYVLVELSRSLVDYFHVHRLRITFILDAAIVFVIREMLIAIFKQEFKPEMIYAFSVFLLVLGVLRTSAVIVYQREKAMSNEEKNLSN